MIRPTLRVAAALAALTAAGCGPAIVAGAGSVVGLGVAQERSTRQALTDNEIAMSINARLAEHSGALFRRVAVDVTEGRVVLIGGVNDAADADRAVEIASAVPGVVEVTNEIVADQPASATRYAGDVWISTQVKTRLIGDGRIAWQNYDVDTHDGVVHLTGVARTARELERVAAHAAAVPGVREVVSHVVPLDDPRRPKGAIPTDQQG
jgi:osmotically-inducible protein OsmY